MASLWPSELKNSRVLIVKLDVDNYVEIGGQGFTLIGPSTDESVSKDIVLLLQGGHFTVLEPKGSDSPIRTILDMAKLHGVGIAKPMDLYTPKSFSINETIDKYLGKPSQGKGGKKGKGIHNSTARQNAYGAEPKGTVFTMPVEHQRLLDHLMGKPYGTVLYSL